METLLASLWFGILTSISPCPLATNIAAVSFMGKEIDKPWYVFLSGLAYTLGRVAVYVVLTIILGKSMDAIPSVSQFLQTNMGIIAGPLLILISLIMFGLIKIPLPEGGLNQANQDRLKRLGLLGSFLLGVLFAFMLCPVSAALFFGNLINTQGKLIPSILYGLGTGIPVMVFAFILAFSFHSIAKAYNAIVTFEKWARKITAVLFLGVGIYLLSIIFSFSTFLSTSL